MNIQLIIYMSLLVFIVFIGLVYIWTDAKKREREIHPYIETAERDIFQRLSWLRSQMNNQPLVKSSTELGEIKRRLKDVPQNIRWIFIQDIDEVAMFLAYKSTHTESQFPTNIKKDMYAILTRSGNAFVEGDKELAHKYYMQAELLYPKLTDKDKEIVGETMEKVSQKIQ